MPYVRRRSIRRRRRTTRRRSVPRSLKMVPSRRFTTSRTSRSLRPKWTNPLAQGALVKFRYIDNAFDLSTAAATYRSARAFRGNSVYDPDATGLGVQPYGFDEYSALFSGYIVYASKIKVRFATTGAYKVIMSLLPLTSSSLTYDDPSDLRAVVGSQQRVLDNVTGFTRSNYMRAYWTTRKAYPGYSPRDSVFAASTTANPTAQWYWWIVADSADIATDASVSADVQVTYYCIMRRTTNQNES